MVGQSHSRANSSTNTGDRKGVDYPFLCKIQTKTPWGLLSLCADEKVIGGGIASIWVKGVIIVVEEVITRGTAPKGTLYRYRATGNRVRAPNSQSS
jgi:hypothetical protein